MTGWFRLYVVAAIVADIGWVGYLANDGGACVSHVYFEPIHAAVAFVIGLWIATIAWFVGAWVWRGFHTP